MLNFQDLYPRQFISPLRMELFSSFGRGYRWHSAMSGPTLPVENSGKQNWELCLRRWARQVLTRLSRVSLVDVSSVPCSQRWVPGCKSGRSGLLREQFMECYLVSWGWLEIWQHPCSSATLAWRTLEILYLNMEVFSIEWTAMCGRLLTVTFSTRQSCQLSDPCDSTNLDVYGQGILASQSGRLCKE